MNFTKHQRRGLAFLSPLRWKAFIGSALARRGDEHAKSKAWSKAAWYGSLGRVLGKMGDHEGAAAAYEQALSRDDTRGEWHYRLGLVLSNLERWTEAVESFEAGIARDDTRGEWHFRLGLARMDTDVSTAVAAFARALECDSRSDKYRYWLGRCLASKGKEHEARIALAPMFVVNDQRLMKFLSSQRLNVRACQIQARTLFVSGSQTCLARRITIKHRSRADDYFEHTSHSVRRSTRTRAFYEAFRSAFGNNAPDFVPKLHYCEINDRCGYFLYDYIAAAPAVFPDYRGGLNLKRAIRVVERIAEISKGFCEIPNELGDALGTAEKLSKVNAPARLADACRNARCSDEAEALAALEAQWSFHQTQYETFRPAFVHGDLSPENVLFDADGKVSVIDWETCGIGPMGCDLIHYFRYILETDEFEILVQRYFDLVAPQTSQAERRYIAALLAVMWSLAKRKPLPLKWVHHLANVIVKRPRKRLDYVMGDMD
jgi:tetratricopeptide (TPR) repeat protein